MNIVGKWLFATIYKGEFRRKAFRIPNYLKIWIGSVVTNKKSKERSKFKKSLAPDISSSIISKIISSKFCKSVFNEFILQHRLVGQDHRRARRWMDLVSWAAFWDSKIASPLVDPRTKLIISCKFVTHQGLISHFILGYKNPRMCQTVNMHNYFFLLFSTLFSFSVFVGMHSTPTKNSGGCSSTGASPESAPLMDKLKQALRFLSLARNRDYRVKYFLVDCYPLALRRKTI